MTGFAASQNTFEIEGVAFTAQWDLRSVNGRGLDLRLRLPDWLDGLEPQLRKRAGETLKRGNVSVSLKLARIDSRETPRLNQSALAAAVAMVLDVEAEAAGQGLHLAPITAADLLAIRGVTGQEAESIDPAPIVENLVAQVAPLLAALDQSRRAEGDALRAILTAQVNDVEVLVAQATALADDRRIAQAESLKAALERIGAAAAQADPARLEQELALLAIKSDITEELDRLRAHVATARALLGDPEPVGRRLDFLTQEFNREANTLCSKAQHAGLTRIGLDLKTVIDQMREQVQNVE